MHGVISTFLILILLQTKISPSPQPLLVSKVVKSFKLNVLFFSHHVIVLTYISTLNPKYLRVAPKYPHFGTSSAIAGKASVHMLSEKLQLLNKHLCDLRYICFIMVLTKAYLRYVNSGNFGVIASSRANVGLIKRGFKHDKKHEELCAVVPALENVQIWDVRTGEKVS